MIEFILGLVALVFALLTGGLAGATIMDRRQRREMETAIKNSAAKRIEANEKIYAIGHDDTLSDRDKLLTKAKAIIGAADAGCGKAAATDYAGIDRRGK